MLTRLLSRNPFSSWIYASKYEQLANNPKGKLVLSPIVYDIGDVTLRMHQHIFASDIILCQDYRHTNNLLYSLNNKLSYIEDSPATTDLVISETKQSKSVSEQLVELSQHLKYNEQMYILKKEAFNSQQMVKQQNEIKKYNERQFKKQQILDYKTERGYGYIINLEQQKPDLLNYLAEGLNVIYLYPEGGKFIEWFLSTVEDARYPYEILPGPSQIIATLALTGFPADRFGIQYYLTDTTKVKLLQILTTRKRQCFSVGVYEQLGNLQYLLTQIEKVYGSHQMIFIKVEQNKDHLLKEVGFALEFIKGRPIPSSRQKLLKCVVIIAPYAIEYNSEYKEKQFEKHYLNELIQSDSTTLYEVQKITKKLEAYRQPKKYEIDSIKAAKYLSDILPTQDDALTVLQQLLRISGSEARRILLQSKNIPNDVLQIERK